MLFWWRITRYDPARRDSRGAYVGETWTSISDIGRKFDGEVLTSAEYTQVESAYLTAVADFARDSEITALEVRGHEFGGDLKDGDVLGVEECMTVVRAMLRDELFCRLEDPDGHFAVHVGYDLYMYVGSDFPCDRAVESTRNGILYVDEELISPYAESDETD